MVEPTGFAVMKFKDKWWIYYTVIDGPYGFNVVWYDTTPNKPGRMVALICAYLNRIAESRHEE